MIDTMPPPSDTITVATYNIYAGLSSDAYRHYLTRSWGHITPLGNKQANLDQIAEAIADFDVVALQEADSGSIRSGFTHQAEYLAQRAGFDHCIYQANRKLSRLATSGNAILSRVPVKHIEEHALPGLLPGRGALCVELTPHAAQASEHSVHVIATHLALHPKTRHTQCQFLTTLMRRFERTVVLGDFNAEIHEPAIRLLIDHAKLHIEHALPPSFPSWSPVKAIDHILTSENLLVLERWSLPNAGSDHLGIAARIAWHHDEPAQSIHAATTNKNTAKTRLS